VRSAATVSLRVQIAGREEHGGGTLPVPAQMADGVTARRDGDTTDKARREAKFSEQGDQPALAQATRVHLVDLVTKSVPTSRERRESEVDLLGEVLRARRLAVGKRKAPGFRERIGCTLAA
jgi:hypothetical protein